MPLLKDNEWEPHGFTIFCDDLREEKSGKTTYVGVYADTMYIVGDLPTAIPSLHFAIHLFSQPGRRFSSLKVGISLPGELIDAPSIFTEVPTDTVPENVVFPNDYGDKLEHPRAHLMLKFGISPFVIERYGRIRVNARWDERLIPLSSLLIAPPPEVITSSASLPPG